MTQTNGHSLKIDKGIPLAPRGGLRFQPDGKFANFEPGDSAFLADANLAKTSNAAHAYGRKHGWKFAARKVRENGVLGVRVWRTA